VIMNIRAYNATRQQTGGPFSTWEDTWEWVQNHLDRDDWTESAEYLKELEQNGITCVIDDPDACAIEDVVVFDADRFAATPEGYMEEEW
jgi:hypothetical protein